MSEQRDRIKYVSVEMAVVGNQTNLVFRFLEDGKRRTAHHSLPVALPRTPHNEQQQIQQFITRRMLALQ